MSEGNDTDFYLKKGFDVLGVEADPVTYQTLQTRFSEEISAGRLEIINAAASATNNEKLSFFVNDHVQGHSRILTKDAPKPLRAGTIHEVKTVNWTALSKKFSEAYYCKIDIEGAEIPFLDSFEGHKLPKYISAESHSLEPIIKLHQMGYKSFKLINQTILHTFVVPKPPLEGKYLPNHKFQHASGFFGEELPGSKWLSFNEVMEAYFTIEKMRAFETLIGKAVWYDCHARLT